MRLKRATILSAAAFGVVAAWPQWPLPRGTDHSQHAGLEMPPGHPLPSMTVRIRADGMDGYNLFLDTANFRFTPQNAGMPAIPNEGHAHLYVNGEKLARLYAPWHHLPSSALHEGVNRIELEFSANDHSVWSAAGEPLGADVLIDTRSGEEDPVIRERVQYALDWNWGQAEPRRSGGWAVRTDLGYTVRVGAGRLVTRGLELVPCHAFPPPRAHSPLGPRIGPAPVRAGHSSLIRSESRIPLSQQEDLLRPRRTVLDSLTVTDPEYCRVHYLLARATRAPPGAAAIEVSGTWAKRGRAEETPFRIRSTGAFGGFVDLKLESGGSVASLGIVGGIELTVSRPLGAMFDGVDFAAGSSETHGMQILRTLVSGATATVQGR